MRSIIYSGWVFLYFLYLNLHINILYSQFKYNWKDIWHEIVLYLKYRDSWHQIIGCLDWYLAQNSSAIRIWLTCNMCLLAEAVKDNYCSFFSTGMSQNLSKTLWGWYCINCTWNSQSIQIALLINKKKKALPKTW